MTRRSKSEDFTALPPFSKNWWLTWYRRLATGRPVHAMVTLAKDGKGWTIPSSDLPSDDERADCAPVMVGSENFERWSRYVLAVHGARLPKPDRAAVAFLPTPAPPDGMDDSEAA